MPKTWVKIYNWIFNHKQAFDMNDKEFSKEFNEVEATQDENIKNVSNKVKTNKTELVNEHNEIIKKEEQMQTQRNELEGEIQSCKSKHQKYTRKQK